MQCLKLVNLSFVCFVAARVVCFFLLPLFGELKVCYVLSESYRSANLHAALNRLTAHSNGTMLYTSVTPSNAEQTYHSSQREISSV